MTLELILIECREIFGGKPREFSLWDRLRYLDIRKPYVGVIPNCFESAPSAYRKCRR